VANAKREPKNIGELIDQIDRIREELMTIQRSLEKLETALPNDHLKRALGKNSGQGT
jgi:hypothetical protein